MVTQLSSDRPTQDPTQALHSRPACYTSFQQCRKKGQCCPPILCLTHHFAKLYKRRVLFQTLVILMQPSLPPKPTVRRPLQVNQTRENRTNSGPKRQIGVCMAGIVHKESRAHEDPSVKNVCLALGRTPTPGNRIHYHLQLDVALENSVQVSARSRKVE